MQNCFPCSRLSFLLNIFLCLFLWPIYTLAQPITVKILGINDFHGQISAGQKINNRPVGGAAVLASYLKQGKPALDDNTLLAFSGDLVGASPPISGLLDHEPSMLFFNSLGNAYCTANHRMNPKCNLVATVGNHDFDRGQQALFDLVYGSSQAPSHHWTTLTTYPGSTFPYISANIVNTHTGKLLFPPYVIKEIKGIKIAFIGAILKDTPQVVLPKNIDGITFLDEADAINYYIPQVKAKGATIIVALIHQGGEQSPYTGATRIEENPGVTGPILSIINRLDDQVDVVMGGHYHLFINAYLPNQNGKKILVTEANSYSTSFAEITLSIDSEHHTLLNKSARILTTYADEAPGSALDASAAELVAAAENAVLPMISLPIGTLQNDLLKESNPTGESALGNLVADSFRNIMNTDIGIINIGALRADLFAGTVTWGNLYAVQPFENVMGTLNLSGQDIYELLEQQWSTEKAMILQISGLHYTYDLGKPIGQRILAVWKDQTPLQRDKIYTISTTEFLAKGGDGFTVMQRGNFIPIEDTDLQVLIKYIKGLSQPFTSLINNRMNKI